MVVKFLTLLFACLSCVLHAQDVPPCFKDLETNFFSYELVAQALSLRLIPQQTWNYLYRDLQNRSKQVPDLVRQRAATVYPNPLSPFQPNAAFAILQQVLFDIFVKTMNANYVYSQSDIRAMFLYIRDQQMYKLKPCFGNQIFQAESAVTQ